MKHKFKLTDTLQELVEFLESVEAVEIVGIRFYPNFILIEWR